MSSVRRRSAAVNSRFCLRFRHFYRGHAEGCSRIQFRRNVLDRPAVSRTRQVTGCVVKAKRLESGGASLPRPSPVVRSTGGQAGEERGERPAPHGDSETPHRTRPGHLRAVLGLGLRRLLNLVVAWNRRTRDGQLLAGLNERILRDIGIESTMAERDTTMSFWRLRLGSGLAADRRSARRGGGEYPGA